MIDTDNFSAGTHLLDVSTCGLVAVRERCATKALSDIARMDI